MKWYARNVGDVASATADLSNAEFGMYDRLMDHYYSKEKPLPLDLERLYNIAKCATEEERAGVQRLMSEFFEVIDGVYRNLKADAEIDKTHKISKKRAAAGGLGAATTNKNRSAIAGFLPDEPKVGSEVEEAVRGIESGKEVGKTSAIADNEQQLPEVCREKGQQKVGKRGGQSQSQGEVSPSTPLPPAGAAPPVDKSAKAKRQAATEIAQRVLKHLNTKAGTGYHTDGKGAQPHIVHVLARLDDGATEEQLMAVIDAKVKEWGSNPEVKLYLRPATLFNRTKFANYIGQVDIGAAVDRETKHTKTWTILVRLIGKDSNLGRVMVTFSTTLEKFDVWECVVRCARNPANRRQLMEHTGYCVVERESGETKEVLAKYSGDDLKTGLKDVR